jgi:uncharacterized protein YydD (DUF2326 family)
MLLEVRSDKFRTGSVRFRPGLNVVLGDENATNSIGKSTLLMVIDFAFGGNALLSHNTDLVTELGHHDYFFSFQFEDDTHRFRRGTNEPSVVYICNEQYEPERPIDVEEYTAFLKHSYHVDLPDLSFRALVGLYLRVWGKDNLSVERPLHVVQTQPARECVDTLIKTFGRYDSIRDLARELASTEAKAKALAAATKHDIVPAIGKREYANNQKRIAALEAELADIRSNLAKYATNLSSVVNKEVLQLKLDKDRLLALRLTLAGRLQRVQRNLLDNRIIRSETFRELTRFFPEINQDRLERIEEFHSEVAKLLRAELKGAEGELKHQVGQIDEAIADLDEGMARSLSSVDEPGVLVDRVFAVAVALKEAKEENERFEDEGSLRASVRVLRTRLAEEKQKVLSLVEAVVNDGMRRIVTSVFGEDRKSPRLGLHESSYSFEVYDDTGTGTAYASLVVFDLTVFLSTRLPVVAHDTLLFKNIENDSVASLLNVYMETTKQSFIALDEIEKYGASNAELLRQRSVIRLDDDHVLYVKDWRT